MGLFGNLGKTALGLGVGSVAPAAFGASAMAGTDLFNAYMSWKNYQLQKDQYGYQKDLQKQMFNREDTSYSRSVLDLKNAGLSPTLAAGSSLGAGPVVSTSAPQMDQVQNSMPQMIMSLLQMDKDFAVKDQQIQNMGTQRELDMRKMNLVDAQSQNVRAGTVKNLTQAALTALEHEMRDYDFEWWKTGGKSVKKPGLMPTKGSPGLFTGVGITNSAIQDIIKRWTSWKPDDMKGEGGGGKFRGSKKSGKSGGW